MLPDSIPCVADGDDFLKEPIQLLARGRASHGNLFAVRKEGPIFSRTPDCAGVVAAFGIDNQRTVLTDMESFELPISAAEKLQLPANLVNLNRSLHSMRGTEHSDQKRRLIGLLNRGESSHRAVWTALEEKTANWTVSPVELAQQMRELTFHASFRMLFGNGREVTRHLALLLQAYFHLRREAASAGATPDRETLEQLAETGNLLDSQLRDFIRECGPGKSTSGLFAGMAAERGSQFSEDEIVGHMNVFFISTTEPVAVALSWVFLVLTQLPQLRKELQSELKSLLPTNAFPTAKDLNQLALLDSVINETLRLLPPNALMTRITTRPVRLNGIELPGRCEVLLSPFISQRDKNAFHRPNEFLPGRWRESPPSPFLYFPFGAGGHSCIGRGIAMDMIKTALAYLLPRFNPVLAEDQAIRWSIRIMLTPNPDPKVIFCPLSSQNTPPSGTIKGPLATALNLNEF